MTVYPTAIPPAEIRDSVLLKTSNLALKSITLSFARQITWNLPALSVSKAALESFHYWDSRWDGRRISRGCSVQVTGMGFDRFVSRGSWGGMYFSPDCCQIFLKSSRLLIMKQCLEILPLSTLILNAKRRFKVMIQNLLQR